jgi:hypothetical protein
MKTVSGVFDSLPAAERARVAMLEAGVAEQRIVLSRALTEDGIAGEAPGQSYENQPGQPSDAQAARVARTAAAARRGACVLSVTGPEQDQERIDRLMQRSGCRDHWIEN